MLPTGAGSGGGIVGSGYRRLVVVSFKVEQELLDVVEAEARRMGISKSELLRRAVGWYIRYYLKPAVTPTSKPTPKIRFR